MNKKILTISMPKGTTQEEIIAMRNRYKDEYKVNVIISGKYRQKEIIKNFLKARLDV